MTREQGFNVGQNNMTSVRNGGTLGEVATVVPDSSSRRSGSDGSRPSTIQNNSSVVRPSIFSALLPRPCNQTFEPDDASSGSGTHSLDVVQSSRHSASASHIPPPVTPSDAALVRNRSSSALTMALYQRVSRINKTCRVCVRKHLQFLTNLRFGRLGFQNCHGDLSLGIHDMSLEEILALVERLTTQDIRKEELSECLKIINISTTQRSKSITVHVEKDMVCVICQDGYAGDDVICQLPCKHIYHFACIREWLMLKNCCPLCKSSVLP